MDRQPPDDERRLELQPGQRWMERLPAGSRILILDGAARLDGPPDWLGETMHAPRQHLAAGDDWVAQRTGWIQLSATRPCALVWITPSAPGLVGWLRKLGEKLGERLPGRRRISAAAGGRPGARGC